jgi:hypothetical protein
MALNKEVFKTPEDKLRAFDLYQEKMRVGVVEYTDTPFARLRYFLAWMESEVEEEFAEEVAGYLSDGRVESATRRKRREIVDEWGKRHPRINAIFDPRMAEVDPGDARSFKLEMMLVQSNGYCELFEGYSRGCGVREIRLLSAFKDKTVGEFLVLEEDDIRRMAKLCRCGDKTVANVLAMQADAIKLAQELGLLP